MYDQIELCKNRDLCTNMDGYTNNTIADYDWTGLHGHGLKDSPAAYCGYLVSH